MVRRPPVLRLGGVALDRIRAAVRLPDQHVEQHRARRHPRQCVAHAISLERRRQDPAALASHQVQWPRPLRPRRGLSARSVGRLQRAERQPPRQGDEDRSWRRRRETLRHLRGGRRGVHRRGAGREHGDCGHEQRLEVDGRRVVHEDPHVHGVTPRHGDLLLRRMLLLWNGWDKGHGVRLAESSVVA